MYSPRGRYCSKWLHALFHTILSTANESRKVIISMLQMRLLKLGEFKLEGSQNWNLGNLVLELGTLMPIFCCLSWQ